MPDKAETPLPDHSFYGLMLRRRTAIIAILLGLALLLLVLNIAIGSSSISLVEILKALLTGEGRGNNVLIIRNIRLPMSLMALVVGASLGIGGCEIQTILRNPIASPFTLGITNAATFGAALGLILNTNVLQVSESIMVTANAFVFALLASVCIYAFSSRAGAGKSNIVLFGIALNFFFSALTMILQYISDSEDLKSLVFWNMGSLLKTNWTKMLIVSGALIFCFAMFYKNAWRLTAMTLDDTKAKSLGVDAQKIRRMVIILTSLATAFAVSFVGSIGFVGIIAPHIARQLVGEDQRYFLSLSALIGAVTVALSFTISKLIIPGVVLPIGLVTAVVGIPVFLSIIFREMEAM
ncbi:MAG: iron ABC transporter permease [Firmicutes bacterium]|nr:iron ABC transporter permease [Bacillota bacterium]